MLHKYARTSYIIYSISLYFNSLLLPPPPCPTLHSFLGLISDVFVLFSRSCFLLLFVLFLVVVFFYFFFSSVCFVFGFTTLHDNKNDKWFAVFSQLQQGLQMACNIQPMTTRTTNGLRYSADDNKNYKWLAIFCQ